jgi:hypothetical protein
MADVLIKSQSVCLKWDENGVRISAFKVIILQISYWLGWSLDSLSKTSAKLKTADSFDYCLIELY